MDEAVKCLLKRQGPASEEALNVYLHLVGSVLSRSSQEDKDPAYVNTVASLREVMFKLASQFRIRGDKKITAEVAFIITCL